MQILSLRRRLEKVAEIRRCHRLERKRLSPDFTTVSYNMMWSGVEDPKSRVDSWNYSLAALDGVTVQCDLETRK